MNEVKYQVFARLVDMTGQRRSSDRRVPRTLHHAGARSASLQLERASTAAVSECVLTSPALTEGEESMDDDEREGLDTSARFLYGLIHARFIVTSRGLAKMVRPRSTFTLSVAS